MRDDLKFYSCFKMSTWSSSVYDGENPQSVGWHRCSYTRDNQAWIDDLIKSRTILERRVKMLKKERKEQTKELGVGLHVFGVV